MTEMLMPTTLPPKDTRHAVYSGTFDPPTFGHEDIIRRAAAMFEHITVTIADNTAKAKLFTLDERIGFLKSALQDLDNVTVASCSGLLVNYCNEIGARVIVRGLRSNADFNYEFQMALVNRELAPHIETVFLIAANDKMFLSSSVVRELASFGHPVDAYVTPDVANAIHLKFHG